MKKHFLSLSKKGIFLFLFAVLVQSTFAQNCDYTEGDISFTAAAGNIAADYENEYLLTNSSGEILQRSTSTTFTNVIAGTYAIYNVNYETTTSGGEGTSVTGINVGDDINNIGGICYALSAPLSIVVCNLQIEWTDATDSNSEGATAYQPTLTISGGDITNLAGGSVTVEVMASGTATLGTDFQPNVNPITLTIPLGDYSSATTLNFNDLTADDFSIVEDSEVENNETVILTLQNPTNLALGDADAADGIEAIHTYTIIDNDVLSVEFLSTTGSDSETTGGNLPQLSIGGAIITTPVTVEISLATGGTATNNDDFELAMGNFPILLTIPAGDYTTVQNLDMNALTDQDLSITDDANVEPTETFVLELQNGTGVTIADVDSQDGMETQFTYTILDNDCAAAARTLSIN